MLQGALWDVVVIDLEIVAQRRFELGSRAKAGLSNKLTDTSVKAFHHAVRVRVARWNESMFDGHVLAENVEGVLARWDAIAGNGILLFAGKAIRELAAIVREQLDDFDRAGVFLP